MSSDCACFLCSSKTQSVLSNVVLMGQKIDIRYCPICEFYFAWPNLPETKLKEFYSKDYFRELKGNLILSFLKLQMSRIRAASQCTLISKYVSLVQGSLVVEIGAADGSLLNNFKKHGFNVHGFDYSEHMRGIALKNYEINLDSNEFTVASLGEKCDLILMSHVLEHVSNPNALLSKAKAALNEGKFLFVEVPNSPLPNEVDLSLFREYFETTHLTNYRLKSIIILLEQSGFEVLHCERYSNAPKYFPKISKVIGNNFVKGSFFNGYAIETIISAGLIWLNYLFDRDSHYVLFSSSWHEYSDFIRVVARKK